MDNLPFSIENLNSDIVREAIINGYEPKKDDLLNNPELLKYDWFIWLAFSYDPSVITLIPDNEISETILDDAINRGFVMTKNDILSKPALFKYKNIVESTLLNDPSLVVYIDKDMSLSNDVLSYVLSNYEITEEDLKKHKKLCSNKQLMTMLGDKYEMYSAFTSKERKKEIISNYLHEGKIDEIEDIPFLIPKFGSKVDARIMCLTRVLNINIDEDNIDMQERYMGYLHKIVDSQVDIIYTNARDKFEFNNINALDTFIKDMFDFNKDTQTIAAHLYRFVNGTTKREFISFDYINEELIRLKNLYKSNKLTNDASTDFYNEILNDFENRYKSEYKRYLMSSIKDSLKISDKKRSAILNGRKINKVDIIIKNKDFGKINTTKEEFVLKLKELRSYINSIKKLRKNNIVITDEIFSYFEYEMLKEGKTSFDTIDKYIGNKEISKIVYDKYNQFKMRYIGNMSLDKDEEHIDILDKEKIEFNYNNYKILDKKRFCDNLASIILNLSEEDEKNIDEICKRNTASSILLFADMIEECKSVDEVDINEFFKKIKDKPYKVKKLLLDELYKYNMLVKLIPFANMTKEFKTEDFINILAFYDETIAQIFGNTKEKDSNAVLNNLSNFITLSKGFLLFNISDLIVLGKKVIDEVGKYNAYDYLNLYLKAYNRFKGSIPRVYGKINNYTYESANYRDTDKLIIGYVKDGSCIRLDNDAGKDTLIGCMLNENDDVILIKDENNDLVARMLIFRRGNGVMIAPLVTKYDNENEILTREFLDDIAGQIISGSELNIDNIDFVFVSFQESKALQNSGYDLYRDPRFYRIFPHADLDEKAFLIRCNKSIANELDANPSEKIKIVVKNVDFNKNTEHSYLRKREDIKLDKSEEELTRIKALSIKFLDDEILKKELNNNFKPFNKKDYQYVVSGEDWYIAVRNDNTIEEVLVPNNDPRSQIEFETAKEKLKKGYSL